jgi:hypothetical protein
MYVHAAAGGDFLIAGSLSQPTELGLLIEDAPRETRMQLMQCREHILGPYFYHNTGCYRITLIGHATSCTRTRPFYGSEDDTCLNVEGHHDAKLD